jgi:hypothetical protein
MGSITLVDATDLTFWANRRDAQSLLPTLLRRLIFATVERVVRIGFPSGEGVQLGGWDGILTVENGTAFIPNGTSAWELSTSTNIKDKADSDYKKRSAAPCGITPADSAFVFVTPRRWGRKNDWVNARQSEKVWREVRAWDADDLEQCLETAPSVHVWFSVLLGKHPENAIDLDNFWIDWSGSTSPNITSEFLLSGRSEIVKHLHDWLHGPQTVLSLQAESINESLAVFAAILQQLSSIEKDNYISRTLIVRDMSEWCRLTASEDCLILVPTFNVGDAITRAIRAKHRVLIPLGSTDSAFDNTVIVPQISSEEATKILVACGKSEDSARELAKLAHRSLTSFRRKLALNPEIHQPKWARPESARPLIPVMLVGAWDSARENDCKVIATLAQTSYEEVNRTLVRWSSESDPPVRRVGDAWFIVSKEDAWPLLARYLTRDDFERFNRVVLDVLGTPDPRFDLSEDKRWMAGALGHIPLHSSLLRKGIADTLSIIGARSDKRLLSIGLFSQDFANRTVKQLLDHANADWRVWASLSHLLPLIAEAAPDIFLSAVEKGLEGEQPILIRLFTDQKEALFSSSPHTGLLWALETLAWNQNYLGRSALLLAKTASLDPGGKLSNRPQNSLRDIFLLWYPQTTATLEQRLQVIDTLRKREPEVSWQLLKQLMPESHSLVLPTPKPHWQEWDLDRLPHITNKEYFEGVHNIAKRMIDDVDEIGKRWCDIISILPKFPVDLRDHIVNRLSSMNTEHLLIPDRTAICSALRSIISHYRSFSDENRALPQELINRLEENYRRFEPQDSTARYSWLFGNYPLLLEGFEHDWRARQKALEIAQQDVITNICSQDGIDGVLKFAGQVDRPDQVGVALGKRDIALVDEDRLLHEHLSSADSVQAKFARGFVVGRICKLGRDWASQKLANASKEWSPRQRAEFLTCLPCDECTWGLAESLDLETDQQYWRLVSPYMIDETDMERATRQLLKYDRPHAAVDFLGVYMPRSKDIPTSIIIDALEQSLHVSAEDDPPGNSFSYHVGQLFNLLYASKEVDEGRIAKIEWAFLPLFRHNERAPKFLHRELTRNPDFFSEVVSLVYRAKGEEPREVSQEEHARAMNGHRLLESFRTVPGTADNGSIDVVKCKDWVQRARKALLECGRGAIGDEVIGQVLSGSPCGDDGAWPHPAVRDVIEEAASTEIERGLSTGLFNSRGIVSKGLYEGGEQEYQIADRYGGFADLLGDRWPRTAAMLRRIADSYREKARREDRKAEIQENWD